MTNGDEGALIKIIQRHQILLELLAAKQIDESTEVKSVNAAFRSYHHLKEVWNHYVEQITHHFNAHRINGEEQKNSSYGWSKASRSLLSRDYRYFSRSLPTDYTLRQPFSSSANVRWYPTILTRIG
ncbi:hypothetical protein GJ496_001772 [Pomphorhynchus laevis]|nr:hypothetical protein GJ496_001772 [Pomphorhynchus laevis]